MQLQNATQPLGLWASDSSHCRPGLRLLPHALGLLLLVLPFVGNAQAGNQFPHYANDLYFVAQAVHSHRTTPAAPLDATVNSILSADLKAMAQAMTSPAAKANYDAIKTPDLRGFAQAYNEQMLSFLNQVTSTDWRIAADVAISGNIQRAANIANYSLRQFACYLATKHKNYLDSIPFYSGNDLYFLGSGLIKTDVPGFQEVVSADIRQLALALRNHDKAQLTSIRDPSLRYMGLAVLDKDKTQLVHIQQRDFVLMAEALMTQSEAIAKQISIPDLRTLTQAILRKEEEMLNLISFVSRDEMPGKTPLLTIDNPETASEVFAWTGTDEVTGTDLYMLGLALLTEQPKNPSTVSNLMMAVVSDDVFNLGRSMQLKIAPDQSFYNQDLKQAAWVLGTQKPDSLKKIKSTDWAALTQALLQKDEAALWDIKDDNLFYFGSALLKKSLPELSKIQRFHDDDLYHLGLGIIRKDESILEKIVDNSLYYFGIMFLKPEQDRLSSINDVDIRALATALNRKDTAALKTIHTEDLVFLGQALLTKSATRLDFIKHEGLYRLGIALFNQDEEGLNQAFKRSYVTFNKSDLYHLGIGLLKRDEAALKQIQQDDLYHMGYTLLNRDAKLALNIGSADIRNLTEALLTRNKSKLDGLLNKNLYFFGLSVLEENITTANNIKDQDLYFLASALISQQQKTLRNILNVSLLGSYSASDRFHFGAGVIYKLRSQLDMIQADDLHFLGLALLTGQLTDLDLITQADLQRFGRALLTRKRNFADEITDPDLQTLAHAILKRDLAAISSIFDTETQILAQAMAQKNPTPLKSMTGAKPVAFLYDPEDLFRLGSGLLNKDVALLNQILNDDLFYLAYALYKNKASVLEDCFNSDIRHLGNALLNGNVQLLGPIADPDWAALGRALIARDAALAETIKTDAIYYLAVGLIKESHVDLEYIQKW